MQFAGIVDNPLDDRPQRHVHPPYLGFSESYVSLQVGGEVRRPLGFKIGDWAPLGLPNPRIGGGFVFGGGLKVWHVNFGFRF